MRPLRTLHRKVGLQGIATPARVQLNRLLRRWFAIEMRRYSNIAVDLTRLVGTDAAVILDIGANTGQSAELFSRMFPSATILAVEPFEASYNAMVAKRLQRLHPHRAAIGVRNGMGVLHVNSESTSNSLLAANADGRRMFPERMAQLETVEVEMITLDALAARESLDRIDLIKIDVQGSELEVLQGGKSVLSRTRVIQIECNFIPIYEGSSAFSEVDIALRRAGFDFYNFYGLHQDPESRRLVFGDGLFVNKAYSAGPRT